MKMFVYIPENKAIRDYASFLWELSGKQNSNELILPSGVVELVFNLSKPMRAVLPGGKPVARTPDCFIQGIHTHVLRVAYTQQQHLFGIRMRPHAVKSLLGFIPSEFNNEAVDLTLIKPQFRELWHQLAESASFEERVQLTESYFKPVDPKTCLRTQMLSDMFINDGNRIIRTDDLRPKTIYYEEFESVSMLAKQVSFSTRHLNRKTQELFGLTAEELIRYKRFLRSIELMHSDQFSLTEISYMAGFFDQSHFIRVFKSFTDMTPRIYQQKKGKLPCHLFD